MQFSDTGESLLDIEVLRVQDMNSTSPVKQVTYFIYEYTRMLITMIEFPLSIVL